MYPTDSMGRTRDILAGLTILGLAFLVQYLLRIALETSSWSEIILEDFASGTQIQARIVILILALVMVFHGTLATGTLLYFSRSDLPSKKVLWRGSASWINLQLCAVGGIVLGTLYWFSVTEYLGRLPAGWILRTKYAQPDAFVAIAQLVMAVGVSFSEEIFFRGLCFQFLCKRHGMVIGALVSSVVFTVTHYPSASDWLALAPWLFVVSVILCWTYWKLGFLSSAIAVHAAINISILFYSYWYLNRSLGI